MYGFFLLVYGSFYSSFYNSFLVSKMASTDKDAEKLEESLVALAECEQLMDKAEKDAEIYRIKHTQSIYQKRRDIVLKIPQFWYIVLAENDDFAEYVSAEDLKYLEVINDIYVHHKVADLDDPKDRTTFSITITFKDDVNEKALVPSQTITKTFTTAVEDGEEKLFSEPVGVQWPKELESINPAALKESKKELSGEDKKQYRVGMKSFFAWFAWTGRKPGKEFRNGEDLARLITEDLFPYAVKYYTEALPGGEDESEIDSSEGEELDISDDEGEEEQGDKKRQKN